MEKLGISIAQKIVKEEKRRASREKISRRESKVKKF